MAASIKKHGRFINSAKGSAEHRQADCRENLRGSSHIGKLANDEIWPGRANWCAGMRI